jgi:hypothetical protein
MKFLPSHDNQNTKCTEQRKDIKSSKGKSQVTYKGSPIITTPDFSTEMLKARRSWTNVIHNLRKHKCQPRLLYPATLSITIDGETNIFHDKTKCKHCYSTNLALQRKTPTQEGKLHP